MAQQQSPWLEGSYGWNFGEGGWNPGMDSNLLKFSFMFDRNVDSIIAALPAAVNGQAHFLTTDNRLYFAVGTTYFSTPVPKWFVIVERSTGQTHQYNGTSLVQIDSPVELDTRLDAVELTVASLGTAAFEDVEFFATHAELDVVEATAAGYTDTLRQDIADPTHGAGIVGYSEVETYPMGSLGARANQYDSTLSNIIPTVFDFMTPAEIADVKSGTPVLDHTTAIQAAIDGTAVGLSLGDGWTYNVTRLVGRSKLRLVGNSTLDFSGNVAYASSVTDPLFKIWGSAGAVIVVSSDILQGDTLITVADTTGIEAGDLVELATPGFTGDFEDSSVVVHNGEICQVAYIISGTQLVLADPILSDSGYTTANSAQLRKLTTVDDVYIDTGVSFKGKGRPQPSGAGDNGIVLMYARSPRIHCELRKLDSAAVRFEGCYDYEASGCLVIHDAQGVSTSVNYGIVPSGSSKHGRIFGNKCANMRHAVVTSHLSSGLGLDVWGVNRCLEVYDNTIVNTWHAGIATHSDVDGMAIYNNRLFGCVFGINPRERNIDVYNNKMAECGQALYLTARPKDVRLVGNIAQDCTGSLLITSLTATRDFTNITIEGNEAIRCGGGITITLAAPTGSGHSGNSIKDNKFKQITGAGGSQALIRVITAPMLDSEISGNSAESCTGVNGISLDSGGTRVQLTGNNMWDVSGSSFVTAVTGGVYTNCYGKGNFGKAAGWSGSANMTNGATIVEDNTFF